jgi:hypothetical protein
MSNTLFQFDQPHEDWYSIGPVNFSDRKNRQTYFCWRYILRDSDWTVGRNNLYAFLRIKGVLDKNNKPNLKGRWRKYFECRTPKATTTATGGCIPYPVMYISGEGMFAIQKELELTRAAGGAI